MAKKNPPKDDVKTVPGSKLFVIEPSGRVFTDADSIGKALEGMQVGHTVSVRRVQ